MVIITVTPVARKLCEDNAVVSVLEKGESAWEARTLGRRMEDQLVAQLGQWAFCFHRDGNAVAYIAQREECNQDKYRGDGGSDYPGLDLDIKTSLMRHWGDPYEYHLCCRKPSRDRMYVLALLPVCLSKVYLMGWCRGADLLDAGPVQGGKLDGTYAVPARELRPMVHP